MKDFKVWRSILRGPIRITTTLANGQIIDKVYADYTDEDFLKVEEQERALATLTMALSPDIAQGFREYTSAKTLWEALIEVYKGYERETSGYVKTEVQYVRLCPCGNHGSSVAAIYYTHY